MGEAFIVRRGGVSSEETAAPTITIVSETPTGVTFTLKNNDDNTALITHEIDDQIGGVELAAAAVSANITVALAGGTYTLSAFATVVGEVATSATVSVEIELPQYELLFDSMTADDGNPIALPRTEIDITGLSIGKDDTLRLVYTLKHDSTLFCEYSLFPNNLTTDSNYTLQQLRGNGTTISAVRFNISPFAFARNDILTAGFADIKVSNNNKYVIQSQYVLKIGSQSTDIQNDNRNIVNRIDTVSSITSLKLSADRTNGIGVGSKIALYKVTEAA